MNRIKNFLENEKHLLWLTFLVAFAIRFVYGLVYYSKYGTSLFVDDWDYISYAQQILKQGILVPNIDEIASNGHQVGIGWPLIIAAIIGVFGDNYIPIFILNALFSAIQVVIIYKIAKLVFSKKVALFTLVFTVLYIRFIKFVPFVLKENIIHFGFALVVYLYLKSLKTRRNWPMVLMALVFLIFLHIDERYMVFGPLFVLLNFLVHKSRWKVALRKSAILASIVIIGVIPWTIRNYMVYKRPIILAFQTSEFTDVLFSNQHKFYNGQLGMQKTPYSRSNLPIYEKITDRIQKGESVDKFRKDYKYVPTLIDCVSNGHIPETYSRVEGVLSEAGEFFRISRFRAGFTANGYRFYPKWMLLNNLVYFVSFGIPLFLMLLSFFLNPFKSNWGADVLLLIMVVYSILHILLIHGLVRYRVPIDGFIFIFSAFCLERLFKKKPI